MLCFWVDAVGGTRGLRFLLLVDGVESILLLITLSLGQKCLFSWVCVGEDPSGRSRGVV
jgi:hypothetical protein